MEEEISPSFFLPVKKDEFVLSWNIWEMHFIIE